jgi:hypothetical protein
MVWNTSQYSARKMGFDVNTAAAFPTVVTVVDELLKVARFVVFGWMIFLRAHLTSLWR